MSMQAKFHFAVDGLWIDRSAMGASQEVDHDGRRLVLSLPDSSAAFVPEVDLAWQQASGADGEETSAEVVALRVTAELKSDVLASDYRLNGSNDLVPELASAWHSAERVVARFLEWACIELAQSQHAPSARVLPRPTGFVRILDRNGDRIPLSWNPPFSIQWRGNVPLMGEPQFDEIWSRLRSEERPSRPLQLLADAEFHAFHAEDRNPGLALVLAAVACEMAVKTFLRENATADQAGLVELAIDNPRDVSLAAASLYDKGLEAVAGQSLRVANKPLYKEVTKVFEHRNRFAHGRDLGLTDQEVGADLAAARGALDYLKSLVRPDVKEA